jgi:hypothetical protein
MIGRYIDHLVIGYPTEIAALQTTVDLVMPYALVAAGLWAVWQLLLWIDRLIDRSEARRAARLREPKYRTADAAQMQRDIDKLWHHAPNASGAFWEPWRDTMPPAEPTPRHKVRAGQPTVVPFPSQDAQRRRQS